MTSYSDMLAQSHFDGHLIDSDMFRSITFAQAIDTQQEVLRKRAVKPGGFKVIVRADDGLGAVAPMPAKTCVDAGQALELCGAGLLGFEIELAVILKCDITPDMAQHGIAGIAAAIDRAAFGIEILQTRFRDPQSAGPNAHLADNLSNGGYSLGHEHWHGDLSTEGLSICATVNETLLFNGKARHPLGHPLEPILRYARRGSDPFGALHQGSLITTGALCGVLPLSTRSDILVVVGGAYRFATTVLVS